MLCPSHADPAFPRNAKYKTYEGQLDGVLLFSNVEARQRCNCKIYEAVPPPSHSHRPPTAQVAPLDIFFTMAVPDGAPKEAPDASDKQQEANNSDNLEDNGGNQMTLSSDEVNYLIFR